jgi:hypothetical protein
MPISMDLDLGEKRALVVLWTCETNEVSDVNRLEAKIVDIVLKLGFTMIRFITKVRDPLPGGSYEPLYSGLSLIVHSWIGYILYVGLPDRG